MAFRIDAHVDFRTFDALALLPWPCSMIMTASQKLCRVNQSLQHTKWIFVGSIAANQHIYVCADLQSCPHCCLRGDGFWSMIRSMFFLRTIKQNRGIWIMHGYDRTNVVEPTNCVAVAMSSHSRRKTKKTNIGESRHDTMLGAYWALQRLGKNRNMWTTAADQLVQFPSQTL